MSTHLLCLPGAARRYDVAHRGHALAAAPARLLLPDAAVRGGGAIRHLPGLQPAGHRARLPLRGRLVCHPGPGHPRPPQVPEQDGLNTAVLQWHANLNSR